MTNSYGIRETIYSKSSSLFINLESLFSGRGTIDWPAIWTGARSARTPTSDWGWRQFCPWVYAANVLIRHIQFCLVMFAIITLSSSQLFSSNARCMQIKSDCMRFSIYCIWWSKRTSRNFHMQANIAVCLVNVIYSVHLMEATYKVQHVSTNNSLLSKLYVILTMQCSAMQYSLFTCLTSKSWTVKNKN